MTQLDPYTPPKAEAESQPRERKRTRSERAFAAERRSVALVAFLCIVSLGLYPSIWYIRRTPFVNGLKADNPLPPSLPWALLVVGIINFVIALVDGANNTNLSRPFTLAGGIFTIMVAFRVAHILRSHFRRTGMFMDASGVATFFFGILYLQWVINDAADALANRPPRRKKRRTR